MIGRLLFVLSMLVTACGDGGTSSDSGSGGSGAATVGSGATGSTGGGDGSGGAASSGGSSQAGCNVGGGAGTGGAIQACSDIGATDCFSNYDCPNAADRCENQGTNDFIVPCCVPGARGAHGVGESCTGENDCRSSLCLDLGDCLGVCTDICQGAGECPDVLPQCIVLAFSGTTDKFCFPEAE